MNDKGQHIERLIESEEHGSFPFDMKKGSMSIRLRSHEGEDTDNASVRLEDLMRYDKKELSFGNCNCIIRTETKVLQLLIYFEPLVSIRNCLPLPINIELSNEQTGNATTAVSELQPQKSYQATILHSQNPIYVSVALPWFEKSQFTQLSPFGKEAAEGIKLQSSSGSIRLELFRVSAKSYIQEFVLYSAGCVMNETTEPLIVSEKKLLPGHNNDSSFDVLLLDRDCKLKFSTRIADTLVSSDELNTRVIGDFPLDLKCSKTESLNLGASISSQVCDTKNSLYTKVIVISPRYILLNETEDALLLSQVGSQGKLLLRQKERGMFHFSGIGKEKLLAFTLDKGLAGQELWRWSGSIDCTAPGEYFLALWKKQGHKTLFYKVSVSNHGSTIYVRLTKQAPSEAAYQLHNQLEDISIEAQQVDCSGGVYNIAPESTVPFGWQEPSKNPQLVIKVIHNNVVLQTFNCGFDRIGEQVTCLDKVSIQAKETSIFYEVALEGTSRVLRFFEKKNQPISKTSLSFDLRFKVNNVGVSLIAAKRELLYITLNPVDLGLRSDGHIIASQFRIKTIEIDNNLNGAVFPVMMSPKQLKSVEADHYHHLDILTQSRIKQSSADVSHSLLTHSLNLQ